MIIALWWYSLVACVLAFIHVLKGSVTNWPGSNSTRGKQGTRMAESTISKPAVVQPWELLHPRWMKLPQWTAWIWTSALLLGSVVRIWYFSSLDSCFKLTCKLRSLQHRTQNERGRELTAWCWHQEVPLRLSVSSSLVWYHLFNFCSCFYQWVNYSSLRSLITIRDC